MLHHYVNNFLNRLALCITRDDPYGWMSASFLFKVFVFVYLVRDIWPTGFTYIHKISCNITNLALGSNSYHMCLCVCPWYSHWDSLISHKAIIVNIMKLRCNLIKSEIVTIQTTKMPCYCLYSTNVVVNSRKFVCYLRILLKNSNPETHDHDNYTPETC